LGKKRKDPGGFPSRVSQGPPRIQSGYVPGHPGTGGGEKNLKRKGALGKTPAQKRFTGGSASGLLPLTRNSTIQRQTGGGLSGIANLVALMGQRTGY